MFQKLCGGCRVTRSREDLMWNSSRDGQEDRSVPELLLRKNR